MTKFLKIAGLIAAMMVGGTIIDWVVHSTDVRFYVPAEYYRNKIIFGAIWGTAAYYALKYWWGVASPKSMAVAVPAAIALILQTKYYYLGYNRFFVFLFLFLHFFMFLPFSFYIFRRYRDIFFDSPQKKIAHQKLKRWGIVGLVLLTEALFYAYFKILAK